jgi:hypothetical protein
MMSDGQIIQIREVAVVIREGQALTLSYLRRL